jgi:hypothetical protein
VEHIAQTQILDDSLQIEYPSYFAANGIIDTSWGLTMPEVIFRYYLDGYYPDIFLIYLPLAHAKQNIRLDRLSMEIDFYTGLLKVYFPKTTKFIFMPMYSEFEPPRRTGYWKNHRFEGLLAAEKIDKMDRILYDAMAKDFLDPKSNFYGFLRLIRRITKPGELVDRWRAYAGSLV